MRKKKIKINIFDMEVTASDPDYFIELQNMLLKCAEYERSKKHLSICEMYENMADGIMSQIGAQL